MEPSNSTQRSAAHCRWGACVKPPPPLLVLARTPLNSSHIQAAHHGKRGPPAGGCSADHCHGLYWENIHSHPRTHSYMVKCTHTRHKAHEAQGHLVEEVNGVCKAGSISAFKVEREVRGRAGSQALVVPGP